MVRLRAAALAAIALASVVFGGPLMATEQCAEPEFDAFLARFSEDAEFQRRHVQFPLPKLVVEDQGNLRGPVQVERTIDTWPKKGALYLNAESRKKYQLGVTITPTERGKKVQLAKPDTDFQIDYYFEQRPCWTLVRMQDHTI